MNFVKTIDLDKFYFKLFICSLDNPVTPDIKEMSKPFFNTFLAISFLDCSVPRSNPSFKILLAQKLFGVG